jgi:hypothetical protein
VRLTLNAARDATNARVVRELEHMAKFFPSGKETGTKKRGSKKEAGSVVGPRVSRRTRAATPSDKLTVVVVLLLLLLLRLKLLQHARRR